MVQFLIEKAFNYNNNLLVFFTSTFTKKKYLREKKNFILKVKVYMFPEKVQEMRHPRKEKQTTDDLVYIPKPSN